MRLVTETQRKIKLKNTLVIIVFLVLIVMTFVVSMNTGYIKLSPMEVMRTFLGIGT